jgi:type II secretory pathway pseudopilin PulG
MAATSDSGEASDIFWPGYVDAVTNLAINLLFVIAVMSIVVLGATLQLAQMTKKKAIEEAQAQQTATSASHTQDKQKGERQKDANAQSKDETVSRMQQTINEVQAKLEVTQKKLDETQRKLAQTQDVREEVVQAKDNKPTEPKQANKMQSLTQSAIVVVFSPDVVTLSAAEVTELMGKLKRVSPLQQGRWQITVISPKGFSEAARLSFYRANAVRNALLENGAPSTAIDLKIHESTQAGADNSKVLLRWMP